MALMIIPKNKIMDLVFSLFSGKTAGVVSGVTCVATESFLDESFVSTVVAGFFTTGFVVTVGVGVDGGGVVLTTGVLEVTEKDP